MKLERFDKHHDAFDMLDLRLYFDFKTTTSIGFLAGPIPTGPVTRIVFGNLQVHHPCSGHIQTYIFAQLPKRYGEPKVLIQMYKVLFHELGIAEDETYELHYTDAADGLGVSQRKNREGIIDAI
jgi:hypothetical protein